MAIHLRPAGGAGPDLSGAQILVKHSRGLASRLERSAAHATIQGCYERAVGLLMEDPKMRAYFEEDSTKVNVNFSTGRILFIREGKEVGRAEIGDLTFSERGELANEGVVKEKVEAFSAIAREAVDAHNGAASSQLKAYNPQEHISSGTARGGELVRSPQREADRLGRSELKIKDMKAVKAAVKRDIAKCKSPGEAQILMAHTRYAMTMVHEYRSAFQSLKIRYETAYYIAQKKLAAPGLTPRQRRETTKERDHFKEQLQQINRAKAQVDNLDLYAIYTVIKANARMQTVSIQAGDNLGPSSEYVAKAAERVFNEAMTDHAPNLKKRRFFRKKTVGGDPAMKSEYANHLKAMVYIGDIAKHQAGVKRGMTFEEALILNPARRCGFQHASFMPLPQGVFANFSPEIQTYLADMHEGATAFARATQDDILDLNARAVQIDGEDCTIGRGPNGRVALIDANGDVVDNGLEKLVDSEAVGLKGFDTGEAIKGTPVNGGVEVKRSATESMRELMGELKNRSSKLESLKEYDASLAADDILAGSGAFFVENPALERADGTESFSVPDPRNPDRELSLPPLVLPKNRAPAPPQPTPAPSSVGDASSHMTVESSRPPSSSFSSSYLTEDNGVFGDFAPSGIPSVLDSLVAAEDDGGSYISIDDSDAGGSGGGGGSSFRSTTGSGVGPGASVGSRSTSSIPPSPPSSVGSAPASVTSATSVSASPIRARTPTRLPSPQPAPTTSTTSSVDGGIAAVSPGGATHRGEMVVDAMTTDIDEI